MNPTDAELNANQAARVGRYFNVFPRDFHYLGRVAEGEMSIVFSVLERSDSPYIRKPRHIVVKRSWREEVSHVEDDIKLDNEIEVVQASGSTRLRGAPHIAQPVYLSPNPLIKLSRPYLIVEFVENGTLKEFYGRVIGGEVPLPDGVLLGFFFCPYPDRKTPEYPPFTPEQPLPLEEIPDEDEWGNDPQAQWVHGNMTMDNILIGDHNPLDGEHILTPILKLIDFGAVYDAEDPEKKDIGIKTNIYDIGRIMRILMTLDDEWDPAPGDVTVEIDGVQRTFATAAASLHPASEWPNLDPDLITIVLCCQAVDVDNQPSLAQLMHALDHQAAIKNHIWYRRQKFPTWRTERTRDVNLMINELIYYP
ncbi:hypothetical protein DL762_003547 [Monosporascus cannonballus]|uniref:Protein kinase domain-containing protein n=1 Tax=Monosporascus cannonballus TaxID=155416 RepID=A0ABY0HDB6_9PEZI|nr:hypothetical protein DL762_003547 [Monosporascus cannonballus]